MENVTITKVNTPAEVKKVVILARKIWRRHYPSIISKRQIDYMLAKFQSQAAITQQIKKGSLYFLIKTLSGPDSGYIALQPRKDEMFLSKIYLVYSRRGKGCGRQVIEFIRCLAQKKQYRKLVLTVNKNNTGAIEFYKKCGFNNVASIVQDIGAGFVMDDYRMEKTV